MDFQRAWAELLRDMIRQAQREADRAIREGFTEPLEQWLNDLLSRRLPHDWQAQLRAKLQTLADDGFTLAPASLKTLEQWILVQAERRGLLPYAEDDLVLSTARSQQPDFWENASTTLNDGTYVVGQALMGVVQGAANSLNGLQDSAIAIANLGVMAWNWSIGWVTGNQVTYFELPDWSENLFIEGDAWHGVGKFAGGEGLTTLLTFGAGHLSKLRYLNAAEKAAASVEATAAVEAAAVSGAEASVGIAGAVPRYGPVNAIISKRTLQKVFDKHGADFGLKGNWHPSRAAEVAEAITKHLNSPTVRRITGTYRGKPAIHTVDPTTGVNVITDLSGNFIGGWKLGAEQLEGVLKTGRLY